MQPEENQKTNPITDPITPPQPIVADPQKEEKESSRKIDQPHSAGNMLLSKLKERIKKKQKKVADLSEKEEKLDFLKRDEVKTMQKDIAKLRGVEADEEKEKILNMTPKSEISAMNESPIEVNPEPESLVENKTEKEKEQKKQKTNIPKTGILSLIKKTLPRILAIAIPALIIIAFLYWFFMIREPGPEPILGCANQDALNYNPDATEDDGSCVFEPGLKGCANPNALNYNPDATEDDGSCLFKPGPETVLGCANQDALNYNPDATEDDGSCVLQVGINIPVPLFSVDSTKEMKITDLNEISPLVDSINKDTINSGIFNRLVIINEAENRLVFLNDLAQAYGMNFLSALIDKLDPGFTLALYGQKEGNRMALVIKVTEGEGLLEELKKGEEMFEQNQQIEKVNSEFKTYTIDKNVSFRYLTFSRDDFGICYCWLDDYLIITTSFETMKKITNELK